MSFDVLFGRVPRGSIPTNTCLGPVPDQTLIKSFLEEILHNESENHVYALLELYKFDKKKKIYIYITNVFILFSKENIWLGGYQVCYIYQRDRERERERDREKEINSNNQDREAAVSLC